MNGMMNSLVMGGGIGERRRRRRKRRKGGREGRGSEGCLCFHCDSLSAPIAEGALKPNPFAAFHLIYTTE